MGEDPMATDMHIDQRTAETIDLIRRVDEALARRDLDAAMALATDDAIWETTTPPDGERYQGKAAVRAGLEELFRSSPHASFEIEDVVALGDRAFFTWTYRWADQDGKDGHVRGVDLVRVRDGKVAEMLAYVKG